MELDRSGIIETSSVAIHQTLCHLTRIVMLSCEPETLVKGLEVYESW